MDDASPPPIASIDEEWLTIHAAARRIGVTPTAIRNRIKRGTLQTRPNGNFGRLVRVPLTRRGFDWSHRFPLIIDAAGSLRVSSISIDGEAVVCGDDGVSDFDRLHSQGWDAAVFLYAFDVLEIDGDDLRQEPLERRKARLEKVLARAPAGIQFNEHVDLDGATVFQHACKMGLVARFKQFARIWIL